MRILCAPDSFKQTLAASRAAAAMARGAAAAGHQADACPIGDGGEGTMEALAAAMGGRFRACLVRGPMGDPVEARWARLADSRAIVELAQASGLGLVPAGRRDVMKAGTYGTGELIRTAFSNGCQEVLLCVGGSATVDGGAGALQALGAKLLDENGVEITEPVSGGDLARIASVERPRISGRIRIACDVTNPLLGCEGAARAYGPQKGASPAQVELLEQGLAHWARVIGGNAAAPGAGAAGGTSFGLAALAGATLHRGIELVLDAVGFAQRCRGVDLVLTGEGRLDGQSLHGKACLGVSAAAAACGISTWAVVGSTGPGVEECLGFDRGRLAGFISLADQFGIDRAMREPEQLIEQTVQKLADRLADSAREVEPG